MSVPVPQGWEARAVISAIVMSGMCSYTDMVQNKVTIKDVFRMLHLLDWHNYKQEYGNSFSGGV